MKKPLLLTRKFVLYAAMAIIYTCSLSKPAMAWANFQDMPATNKNQESGTISGKVVDEKGESLPGASIVIKELNKIVQITDGR